MRRRRLTPPQGRPTLSLTNIHESSLQPREEIMSRHQSPEQVHAKLKHPVVDGDGHWLEIGPVFSGKMREAGGDKAADGFLKALQSTTDALKMTQDERDARRVAQPNFWN